eukprot:763721-Hanusia_phi.AAC.2
MLDRTFDGEGDSALRQPDHPGSEEHLTLCSAVVRAGSCTSGIVNLSLQTSSTHSSSARCAPLESALAPSSSFWRFMGDAEEERAEASSPCITCPAAR